jgi:hypothetical protein
VRRAPGRRREGGGLKTYLDAFLMRLHLSTVCRLYPERAVRAETGGMSYHGDLGILIAEEIEHRAETRIPRAVRNATVSSLRTIVREGGALGVGPGQRLHPAWYPLGLALMAQGLLATTDLIPLPGGEAEPATSQYKRGLPWAPPIGRRRWA